MKALLFVCVTAFAVANALYPVVPIKKLLRDRKCLLGSSYACTNITTAAECRSVKHCIQTVWEHQILPEDDSSICDTCKEMVKEARDQLLSNETQQELKEVFDRTCGYIPVKEAAKECQKVFDNFVPELVDVLASQMNPQMVCATAGLCNNARLQEIMASQGIAATVPCDNCKKMIDKYEQKFKTLSQDEVLQMFLRTCGRLGSFSDACVNVMLTNFDDIYKYLRNDFDAEALCYFTTECSALEHTHRIVSAASWLRNDNSQECEFCEQMVQHLRTILVANTTEAEFKQMLLGICAQYPSFKQTCTEYVDEYYSEIYNYLLNELNPNEICTFLQLCRSSQFSDVLIRPLLPIETIQRMEIPESRVSINSPGATVKVAPHPARAQLPIERLLPVASSQTDSKLCSFCEYLLHSLQQEITNPKNVEQIKQVLDHVCEDLPNAIRDSCEAFVDQYGNELVALLAQDIDPSVICPKLKVCPNGDRLIEVYVHANNGGQGNCPLCLFAITELKEMIKSNSTEKSIKESLERLCSHLKTNLKEECNEFVERYSREIVDSLMADLTPQEVCEYIKLCKDTAPAPKNIPLLFYGGRIETNEIPDLTSNGVMRPDVGMSDSIECDLCQWVVAYVDNAINNQHYDPKHVLKDAYNFCNTLPDALNQHCYEFVHEYGPYIVNDIENGMSASLLCAALIGCPPSKSGQTRPVPVRDPQCAICKLVMRQLEKILPNMANESEIIDAVHHVCNVLPREASNDCNNFVDKYGDEIVQFLKEAVTPEDICSLLLLCQSPLSKVTSEVNRCGACQATVNSLRQDREAPATSQQIPVINMVCGRVSERNQPLCRQLLRDHAESIIVKIGLHQDEKSICQDMEFCAPDQKVGANRCAWGPGYWCTNERTAQECGHGAVKHCQEKVWKARTVSRVQRDTLLGSNKCTWGPSYWCSNVDNANECQALQHCQDKVWLDNKPSQHVKRSTLIGGNRCTFGPGYWCNSVDNANECGALPYCRDQWKADAPPQNQG